MKRINGKPMAHWETLGKRLVVEVMVRAATEYGWRPSGAESPDLHQSVVHKIAADRLMELAEAEDPELVVELLAERGRCQENLALFVASMGGSGTVGGQKGK